MKRLTLFAGFMAAMATPGTACDLCAIYSANQARGDIGKGFFLGVAEQLTHFWTLQHYGHEGHHEACQYMYSSISQVFVGYTFNDRIGLQLNVSIIYRSFKRPEGFEIDRGTVSGIGDVSLIGHFQPYR